MIRVFIELDSARGQELDEHVAQLEIVNDMADTRASGGKLGSYRVRLSRPLERTINARIRGFPRKNMDAVDLVLWALAACVGGRSGIVCPGRVKTSPKASGRTEKASKKA